MQNLLKRSGIKILILSRGRSLTIISHRIFPEWIEVLVPESEKAAYAGRIKNPLLTIPDNVQGLGRVRNWVLSEFKENCVIMVDDDINNFYLLTQRVSVNIKDPERVVAIIANTAQMAIDLGVSCFGFSQTDIRKYNGTEPFRLCTWVGTVIGVIGRKYKFRDDKFKVDIDFCLKCILHDRIILCDNRYYFHNRKDFNLVGNASFRDRKGYDDSIATLKSKWGDALSCSEHASQVSIKMNVQRKQIIK